MKTLIIFLLILLTCSSMCFSDDFSDIQEKEKNASTDNDPVSILFLLTLSALFIFFLMTVLHNVHKENMKYFEIVLKKVSLKEKTLELLNMQYIQRKISHEEYLKMKKEIEGNNFNNANQTIKNTPKKRLLSITE